MNRVRAGKRACAPTRGAGLKLVLRQFVRTGSSNARRSDQTACTRSNSPVRRTRSRPRRPGRRPRLSKWSRRGSESHEGSTSVASVGWPTPGPRAGFSGRRTRVSRAHANYWRLLSTTRGPATAVLSTTAPLTTTERRRVGQIGQSPSTRVTCGRARVSARSVPNGRSAGCWSTPATQSTSTTPTGSCERCSPATGVSSGGSQSSPFAISERARRQTARFSSPGVWRRWTHARTQISRAPARIGRSSTRCVAPAGCSSRRDWPGAAYSVSTHSGRWCAGAGQRG